MPRPHSVQDPGAHIARERRWLVVFAYAFLLLDFCRWPRRNNDGNIGSKKGQDRGALETGMCQNANFNKSIVKRVQIDTNNNSIHLDHTTITMCAL
jgi:hypothetical protein